MKFSRWKLLAGVFGLSVCGLAALAEPACRTVGHGANRQQPAPVAEAKPKAEPKGGATLPPPIDVAPPTPGEVKPGQLPSLPLLSEPPKPMTTEAAPPPKALTPTPVDLTLPMLKEDKPKTELPLPTPSTNVPATTAVPDAQPLPQLGGLPLPTPTQLPTPEAKPLPLPTQTPAPVAAPTPLPTPTPVAQPTPVTTPAPTPVQQTLPTATPLTPPAQVQPVEARTTSSEKRLKVSLQLGEGAPRFEVRDGDEVVLKVVCDKVDVKSPTEKGDVWSTLKACGKVKFNSPGGDGFCDELVIMPGTGEVIATGKVQFKYNWGKVETAVTSERMTFRLGATPDVR